MNLRLLIMDAVDERICNPLARFSCSALDGGTTHTFAFHENRRFAPVRSSLTGSLAGWLAGWLTDNVAICVHACPLPSGLPLFDVKNGNAFGFRTLRSPKRAISFIDMKKWTTQKMSDDSGERFGSIR
ncbi:hypothetical protein BDF20DRAFT_988754 [Mycotypha africana]|uniref:uncharacterized protein n=1 Tax=Mycotypha africana TaxID=64632 RepID=UPI002301C51F|nr:uncharacterized protein BDF20DRAFT_988754 [Mycotypha africana]KAI8975221.1 hypothetical protein BDF20DRAFT_988754 [Mycotypha africana]